VDCAATIPVKVVHRVRLFKANSCVSSEVSRPSVLSCAPVQCMCNNNKGYNCQESKPRMVMLSPVHPSSKYQFLKLFTSSPYSLYFYIWILSSAASSMRPTTHLTTSACPSSTIDLPFMLNLAYPSVPFLDHASLTDLTDSYL